MVLVPLRVFSLKRSTPGAFTDIDTLKGITFRVLSPKNMIGDNVLFENWYLLGMKKFQATCTPT